MSDEDDDLAPDEEKPAPEQDSAVDPGERNAKIRKKKLTERDSAEFWAAIFASELGRREMWRLLARFHPFETKIGASPVGFPDERSTWMHLAEQLMGQSIYQGWHVAFPEQVMAMIKENDPCFQKKAS